MVWFRDGSQRLVLAACAQAWSLGVRAGMRLAQAEAMVSGLAVRQDTPDADAAALSALAGWCRRYTPLTRAEPPDGIWLDLSGCAHLFGGEAALLADLSARLRAAGFETRIAIAETPGAACAVARFAGPTREGRTGADPVHAGPGRADPATGSAVSVPQGALRRMLFPLPVAALRLDGAQQNRLHQVGLRRIGLLEDMPRGPLARRFGAGVLLRLDQAFGRVAEPVCPEQPPVRLQERLAFPEPLQTAYSLAGASALLVSRLCARMQAVRLGARLLELVFVRLDGSIQSQSVVLALPSHEARHVGRLLDERLDRIDPGDGIEVIWLVARIAEPINGAQGGLREGGRVEGGRSLAPSHGDALAELAPLIDTLRLRLGLDRLWRPVVVESDVPERSVSRRAPLAARPASEPDGWPASLPRPVRLLDPPQPVRAMSALPDHPPLWFVWRAHRHVVRRADGPERIAGEWWRRGGEMIALRDYFRVEDETGRRFWLFRRGDGTDPGTGDLGWFLHGLF